MMSTTENSSTSWYTRHHTAPPYFITILYIYTSTPSILLSISTISLNIFVIKFYLRRDLRVVSLLYTFISILDILCAIGTIHFFVCYLLYTQDKISLKILDVNAIISFFFIQISCRCSVFCNLVLAVSRTIMILKPFYQIKIKVVKLTCVLYAVPWIVLYGLNIDYFHAFYTRKLSMYMDS